VKAGIKLVVAVVLLAALAAYAVYVFSAARAAKSRRADFFAAVAAINDQIRRALSDHYSKDGVYPNELADLEIPIPPDCPDPDPLRFFSYTSDGNYYILTWELQWGDEAPVSHRETAARGKVNFVEENVDGLLILRTEYPEGPQNPHTRTEKRYDKGHLLSTTRYANSRKISAEKAKTE